MRDDRESNRDHNDQSPFRRGSVATTSKDKIDENSNEESDHKVESTRYGQPVDKGTPLEKLQDVIR